MGAAGKAKAQGKAKAVSNTVAKAVVSKAAAKAVASKAGAKGASKGASKAAAKAAANGCGDVPGNDDVQQDHPRWRAGSLRKNNEPPCWVNCGPLSVDNQGICLGQHQ